MKQPDSDSEASSLSGTDSGSSRVSLRRKAKQNGGFIFKAPCTPNKSQNVQLPSSPVPTTSTRRITRSSSSEPEDPVAASSPVITGQSQNSNIAGSVEPTLKAKSRRLMVSRGPKKVTTTSVKLSTPRQRRLRSSSSSYDPDSESSSDASTSISKPKAKKLHQKKVNKSLDPPSSATEPTSTLPDLDDLLERARNLPKQTSSQKLKKPRLTKSEREQKTTKTHQLLENLISKSSNSSSRKRNLKGNILNESTLSEFSSTCFSSSQISNTSVSTSSSPVVPQNKPRLLIEGKIYEFDKDIPDAFKKYSIVTGTQPSTSDSSIIKIHHVSGFHLSDFCTQHGQYFGHKLVDGTTRKKSIVRQGYQAASPVSPCFLVLCIQCKNGILKSCSNGSYDNFARHLKSVHKLVDPSSLNLGVLTLNDAGLIEYGSFEKYKWSNKRQQTLLQLLLQYIVDGNHPFSDVERFSFKRLVNFLDPHVVLPSRHTIKDMLCTLSETKVKTEMETTLEKVSCATLIVDCWSSKVNKGVLGARICFLDEKFQWKLLTIAVEELHQSHTSSYIGSVVKNIVVNKMLQNKIKHVISDSGRNIIKAMKDLHDVDFLLFEEIDNCNETVGQIPVPGSAQLRLDLCSEGDQMVATDILLNMQTENPLILDLEKEFYMKDMFKPSPCVAHILQLVLIDALEDDPQAKRVDKTIRRLSAFCRNRQMIRKITKNIEGRVLTQPVITRWNSVVDCGQMLYEESMFDTLKTLLEVSHSICKGALKATLPDLLNNEFRGILGEFLAVSLPVTKLTDDLQGDGVTGHRVIPGIAKAYDELMMLKDLLYLEDFRVKIIESFVSRMRPFVVDQDYILATVLAPKYKLWFFEIYQADHPSSESNPFRIPTHNEVKELALVYLQTEEEKDMNFRRTPQNPLTREPEDSCPYSQKIKQKYLNQQQSGEAGDSDLVKYLGMPYSPETPEVFWAKNKSELPRLFEIARAVNCKIATSGPVERLFSLIADVNKGDRAAMDIKTIENTILCKEWFNLPKTYKEAVTIFKPTSEELVEFNSSVTSFGPTTTSNPTSNV